MAAGFLSLVQGAWIGAFLIASVNGHEITPAIALLVLGGVIYIQTRARIAGEIALAIVDRSQRLEFAPDGTDILRRIGLTIAVPLLALSLAFLRMDDPVIVIFCFVLLFLTEGIYRLGGYARWRRTRIYLPTLKALLTGSPEAAVDELAAERDLAPQDFESSVLAISGIAIRTKRPTLLQKLEEVAEGRLRHTTGEVRAHLERTLAVIRADYARLVDPESAAVSEAQALAQIPPSHPRRLSLGLFVATAALDQEDPGSALKALRLLHSRDVMPSAARALVNWLMMESAKRTGDTSLVDRCTEALQTFDIKREARNLSGESRDAADSYTRWMKKASAEMTGGASPDHNAGTSNE